MIHIFYHSADLDGKCSGAIVDLYYKFVRRNTGCDIGNETRLIPFNYNDPVDIEKILPTDIIYFVDVVPSPYDRLLFLDKICHRLIIYDHHKSFIDSGIGKYFQEKEYCSLSIDHAGCQLTWNALFKRKNLPDNVNQIMPAAIFLLGEYDRWNNSDQHAWNNCILPFQYGMRLYDTNPETYNWHDLFFCDINSKRINKIIDDGKTIIKYEKLQNAYVMKNSRDIILMIPTNDYRGIIVNSTVSNSNLFESKWDDQKYDVMIRYCETRKGQYSFSAYSTKDDIDVSKIATYFGGGGHKGAAGWMIKDMDFFRKHVTFLDDLHNHE